MTYAEKFQSLKTAFEKANTKKFNADFAVQITMTDEDCGGTFYIEYKNGNYAVEPYDYVDNNAALTASAASIAKLSKGTVAKDISVFGDETVVSVLASALKPAKKAAKKAPAKKTATKKPAAKKAAAKPAAKKTETKKAEVKAPVAKKAPAAKATATKATEVKTATAKKAPAKKAVAKKDTKTTK